MPKLRTPETDTMPTQFMRVMTLIETHHPRISEEDSDGVTTIDLRTPEVPFAVCESRPNAIVIIQDDDLQAITIGCSISRHMSGGKGYTIQSSITIIRTEIIPKLSVTTSNMPSPNATSLDHNVTLRHVNWAITVAEELLTDRGEATESTET